MTVILWHSWSRQVDNKGCMYTVYCTLYIVYRILYMYRSVPTSVYAAESNGDSRPKLDLSAVAFRSPGQVIKDLCDFSDQWLLPCVVLHSVDYVAYPAQTGPFCGWSHFGQGDQSPLWLLHMTEISYCCLVFSFHYFDFIGCHHIFDYITIQILCGSWHWDYLWLDNWRCGT